MFESLFFVLIILNVSGLKSSSSNDECCVYTAKKVDKSLCHLCDSKLMACFQQIVGPCNRTCVGDPGEICIVQTSKTLVCANGTYINSTVACPF